MDPGQTGTHGDWFKNRRLKAPLFYGVSGAPCRIAVQLPKPSAIFIRNLQRE